MDNNAPIAATMPMAATAPQMPYAPRGVIPVAPAPTGPPFAAEGVIDPSTMAAVRGELPGWQQYKARAHQQEQNESEILDNQIAQRKQLWQPEGAALTPEGQSHVQKFNREHSIITAEQAKGTPAYKVAALKREWLDREQGAWQPTYVQKVPTNEERLHQNLIPSPDGNGMFLFEPNGKVTHIPAPKPATSPKPVKSEEENEWPPLDVALKNPKYHKIIEPHIKDANAELADKYDEEKSQYDKDQESYETAKKNYDTKKAAVDAVIESNKHAKIWKNAVPEVPPEPIAPVKPKRPTPQDVLNKVKEKYEFWHRPQQSGGAPDQPAIPGTPPPPPPPPPPPGMPPLTSMPSSPVPEMPPPTLIPTPTPQPVGQPQQPVQPQQPASPPAVKQQPIQVHTRQDYESAIQQGHLKPGDYYLDPNGEIRQVI